MRKFGKWTIVRRIVQLGVFLLFLTPLVYLAVTSKTEVIAGDNFFHGTLSASRFLQDIFLMDPFAGLQVILASKSIPVIELVIASSIILIVYLLIRPRAFCGWVCPVNLLTEFADYISKKLKIQPKNKVVNSPLPKNTKIWVTVGILIATFLTSIPVFEIFSPVGALSKAIMLGATLGLWVLAAILVLEIFMPGRVWCRSLCPLGGFYHALGKYTGVFRVKIDYDACIHCDKCKIECIANPEILDPLLENTHDALPSGDCMLCGKCVDVCPTDCLRIKPALGTKKEA